MGGRRGGEDLGDRGRPVEPGEARESGSDPGAVRIHRRGDAEQGEARGRVEREGGTERRAETEGVGTRRSEDRQTSGGGDDDTVGMRRGEKTLIATIAVLGVVLLAVLLVLSLLESPEWMQFVVAMVLFAALGVGAYLYVITPSGRGQETDGN